MQINKSKRFDTELEEILDFIAQDKLSAAVDFLEGLVAQTENLKNFPYKYRQSIKSNDSNVRDMIYRGYVVPYKVYDNEIVVLGIFSQSRWEVQ